MNISLPETLRAFVEKRVKGGHYGTASEYVCELIRRDEARQALRQVVRDGLDSPTAGTVDASYWAEKRGGMKRGK